jgi:chromosome partitioning protein
MKKLIFINQKGGSGKSILSYNMAHYLADQGARVLFIDGDEQANSSKSLAKFALPGIGASALFHAGLFALPFELACPSIALLRGDAYLRQVEQSGVSDGELVMFLRARLAQIADRFDYCVIDTAGANSRVANALLIASDYAVLPCRIDPYSIDVATDVIKRVTAIQKNFNPNLVSLGILPNEIDGQSGAQQEWLKQLRAAYHWLVMPVSVPKRAAYREACAEGVPVWQLRHSIGYNGKGNIKSGARQAGREVRAVFDIIKSKMDAS